MTQPSRGAMVSPMPQPPALTPEQRQAALAKAAKVRRERAEVKEKLKLGSINLSELLSMADSNETVGKMKVLSVLESLPGLGKVKARRLMDTVGISESRRLQGLGTNRARGPAAARPPAERGGSGAARVHSASLRSLRPRRCRQGNGRRTAGGARPTPVAESFVDHAAAPS